MRVAAVLVMVVSSFRGGGGGPGGPPRGRGQAVRARVAARAMASMVSAGSARVDDLAAGPGVGAVAGVVGAEDDDAAAGLGQAGDALLPVGGLVGGVVGVGDDDQQAGGAGAGQAEGAVEGVDGAAELLGAVGGGEVGDPGGGVAGAGEGVDPVAVQDGGGGRGGDVEAARARIQAAEATGPVKALMEPEMSQAMPTLSGGAGTRRLVVRVKGSAVGTAPAARWARAASAWRMRSRPGGSWRGGR